MKNQKVIYLYKLTGADNNSYVVALDDPSDSAQICGTGNDGLGHCYEGDLTWAYTWAEQHGMKLQRMEIVIDIPDEGWIGR